MAKDQELLQAVKSNDLGAFRKLLAKIKAAKSKKGGKKYNVNIKDEDGFTAIHHASLTGSTEAVMGLIDLECDVGARDNKGMCPLHLAAWAGKVEVARLLVEAGAEVNVSSENGDTPLILACQHGNSDVADVLLDRGGSAMAVNKNGEASLDLACRFGHIHVVELLLKSREVKRILSDSENKHTEPPLHSASKTGHVEIVRMLLEADANINQLTNNGSALHLAALYGKTAVVKLLLDWGIDVSARNDEGHTALDAVNLFTSSKASADIKTLLKEAQYEDNTVHAKAVRDHFNMYDSSALQFKIGASIIVLEQNNTGKWKGKVEDGEKEKVGYFPSNFVKIVTPRRTSAANKPATDQSGVVTMGTYEMVALPPVPPSPGGFNRNSPRLSSFGKQKEPRFHKAEGEDGSPSPSPKKPHLEPVPAVNGLKPKGSVKMAAHGLQYVQVAVDKPDQVQCPTSGGRGEGSHLQGCKTQYTEVRLPGANGCVEEVDERDEPPVLPDKQHKKPCASNTAEDVWVRNTPTPPPLVPPKAKGNGRTVPTPNDQAFESLKPPAGQLRDQSNPSGQLRDQSNPSGQLRDQSSPSGQLRDQSSPSGQLRDQSSPSGQFRDHSSSAGHLRDPNSPAQLPRVATPELSRKGYEDMSFSPRLGGAETPPLEDVWKQQPVNRREHPRQELSYENVHLPPRGKSPGEMDSMFITDVDLPGEGDDGYVVVNGPSNTTDASGYENVNVNLGGTEALKPRYENVSKDVNYEAMAGGAPAESEQDRRTSGPGDGQEDNPGESKDVQGYEMMNSSTVTAHVSPQYVNIKKRAGNAESGPSQAKGQVPLKMRDYNALYDWLESFKLTIYIDNFVKGGFDMTSVCGITPEDLTAINVKKTGHRKKVIAESAKLEGKSSCPEEKPEDIMTWLRLIGLEQYIPEFMDGGFDDMDFVQDMTVEDLEAIGVTKPGHQRKIWMAVNALKSGDENENVTGSQDERGMERKGYLETSLDGEDSGVSTDEVEPSELLTESRQSGENEVSTSHANQAGNSETFYENSPPLEVEVLNNKIDTLESFPRDVKEISCTGNRCEKVTDEERNNPSPKDIHSEAHETVHEETSGDQTRPQDEAEKSTEVEAIIDQRKVTNSSPVSEDDCPPPRPPPPREDTDSPVHMIGTDQKKRHVSLTEGPSHNEQTDINTNGPGRSVKDLVQKENVRIRTFSADSSVQRPKKPPPPVKPKSFRKEPPKVAPKPRKSGSFSGYSERSSGEESSGERSPTKSVPTADRRSSTGSSPYCWSPPSSTSPFRQSSSQRRSRSNSNSSQSSVDSLIEEFEERKKSFERPGRKLSAPERLNASFELRDGGLRTSELDARADSDLDEQIKHILRRRSPQELPPVSTESSVPPPSLHDGIGTESLNTEERHKEQEIAEDLIKDINNMLSNLDTELDSMFD